MRMRWAEHAARVGQNRNAYRGLVCKTEGRREVNIQMDFHKTGEKGVGQIHVAEDGVKWPALCQHGNELSGFKM